MTIYLIRHGKSDKSLQDTLPHDEFELKRPLVAGEEEKSRKLAKELRLQVGSVSGYDLVHSGRIRSKQTVLAIAKGLGLSLDETSVNLREDFGLAYLADGKYWADCKNAIKDGRYESYAEFFIDNPQEEYFKKKHQTNPGQTLSAEYIRLNMRAVLRRAIERNMFLHNNLVAMVSHEPVITLCLSDLTGKSVSDLKGESTELEYARFEIAPQDNSLIPQVELKYRERR